MRTIQHLGWPILVFPILVTPLQGCDRFKSPEIKSEYQAVLLDNGQAFIGRLEGAGRPYPVLHEVYYVQSKADQDTKQVSNVLIKRGKEWHGPDAMYINAQHIVFIEPVVPDSRVAQLISEMKKSQSLPVVEEPKK
jgi:hypothetical protein